MFFLDSPGVEGLAFLEFEVFASIKKFNDDFLSNKEISDVDVSRHETEKTCQPVTASASLLAQLEKHFFRSFPIQQRANSTGVRQKRTGTPT